jgi:hypothetical protein
MLFHSALIGLSEDVNIARETESCILSYLALNKSVRICIDIVWKNKGLLK